MDATRASSLPPPPGGPAPRSRGASSRGRAWRGLPSLLLAAALLAGGAELLSACNRKEPAGDPRVAKGQALYGLRCGSCHNYDPARDGTLGPAVRGASLELLEARIIHGTYPPGYTPKRDTKIMQKLPLTKDEVALIHAFLNKP